MPGGGWLKQGFECEAGIYETYITIPDSSMPQVTRLELGAVNHLAEYYIGEDEASLVKIYEEITAFTSQTVDLTPHVKPGNTYLLRVFVRAFKDSRPIAPHCAEWCECIVRGIFRSAFIRVYPSIFISAVFIKTYTSDSSMKYDIWISNSSKMDKGFTISSKLTSWNNDSWNYPEMPEILSEIKSGETLKVSVGPIAWPHGQESWWWPNVPYMEYYRAKLHMLRLSLKTSDEIIHDAEVRFGFREIRQVGSYFELNGVRVNFRGDNLQVANYDRVDNGGKGDAIDTLAGFLPPSSDNPGWPKAVDNFLRLNYNVQRQHMIPWTEYMLDVCDETGLILIGESACRWNGFDMEDGRGFYEVKCLQDIIRCQRNHPSVVRWSSKNETQCDDPEYHVELYEAIKELDDTRPVFEEFITSDRINFNPEIIFAKLLDKDDFTWMEHYITYNANGEPCFTIINLNDAVVPLAERPYGLTEADWMRSSTQAGLTYFAVTTALARAQGASDVRPYTLLSSWVSCIPGLKTTDLPQTEENRIPVYGEDNLPDPWSNSGISLLRKACHPLFAFDYEFWRLNKDSNAWGHFPVTSPKVPAGSRTMREITVFNDEFEGSELEMFWEIREGSSSNWIFDKGCEKLIIKPGFMEKAEIMFDVPKFNTFVFLVLRVYKNGRERFHDSLTCYETAGGVDFSSEFNGKERKFK